MPGTPPSASLDRALEEERSLVATLGGFTLEVAGGRFVTHERLPAPRFNFIQDVRVAPERRSAFLERALDHYFQRALRPEIRVAEPVPSELDASLRSLQFVARETPRQVLIATAHPERKPREGPEIRETAASDLNALAGFLVEGAARDEMRRAIEVAWRHPNPEERLVPVVAVADGALVATGLAHLHRGLAGLHAIGTTPAARGQGLATSLVAWTLSSIFPDGTPIALHSDVPRLAVHLEPLGFAIAATYRVYELPRSAELSLPGASASTGPLWRPPRAGSRSGGAD